MLPRAAVLDWALILFFSPYQPTSMRRSSPCTAASWLLSSRIALHNHVPTGQVAGDIVLLRQSEDLGKGFNLPVFLWWYPNAPVLLHQ